MQKSILYIICFLFTTQTTLIAQSSNSAGSATFGNVNDDGSPEIVDDKGLNTECCADHFDDPISNISRLMMMWLY